MRISGNDLRQPDQPSRAVVLVAVVVALLASLGPLRAQGRSFDLLAAGVTQIQAAVASGALDYERLVSLYLARIEAYDRQGPNLHAVIAINPRARAIGRALDDERRTSGLRSPLHGIPIAIKDNIDVSDVPSAGGSLVFAGTYPARDATVVERLRAAGAERSTRRRAGRRSSRLVPQGRGIR